MMRKCIPNFPAVLLLSCLLISSGCATRAGNSAAASSHYSHTLHNRFYEAWVQPKMVGAPHGKVSVPVDVQISPRGRVLSFKIVWRSGYPTIDESITAVGHRVTHVATPPGRAGFSLRIFFDLDVKR